MIRVYPRPQHVKRPTLVFDAWWRCIRSSSRTSRLSFSVGPVFGRPTLLDGTDSGCLDETRRDTWRI